MTAASISAVDDMLMERARSSGEVVLSSKVVTNARRSPFAIAPGFDSAWWCRELRTLVSAGMTVVEALETMAGQQLGRARAEVNRRLVAELQQGKALSVAMLATEAFPAVLIAGVKASERTSALVDALDEFLRYADVLQRLRRQVISAAIYPAVVIALGSVIALFLMLYVVPRFSQMYAGLRGDISPMTRALVGASQLLTAHGEVVLCVLVALAGLGLWAVRRGHIRRWVVALAQRIEPLQKQLDEYRLAKLYQSIALMLSGGYPLDEALAQCATLGLGPRQDGGIRAAHQALARGARVSSAFAEAGLTDLVSLRLLAVGERTGNFDRVLRTIADRHAGHFTLFVERATRIVEPLLLLLVALAVGGIVVMMYMPIFDIASSVE